MYQNKLPHVINRYIKILLAKQKYDPTKAPPPPQPFFPLHLQDIYDTFSTKKYHLSCKLEQAFQYYPCFPSLTMLLKSAVIGKCSQELNNQVNKHKPSYISP